jgi:hypothetical protein
VKNLLTLGASYKFLSQRSFAQRRGRIVNDYDRNLCFRLGAKAFASWRGQDLIVREV